MRCCVLIVVRKNVPKVDSELREHKPKAEETELPLRLARGFFRKAGITALRRAGSVRTIP